MIGTGTSRRHNPLLWFGLASAAAILCGGIAMTDAGLPPAIAWQNGAAWLLGAIAAFGLTRIGHRPGASFAIVGVAILALIATLLGPGQEGVHRWVALGPINANIASLLLPAAIVALGRLGIDRPIALAGALAIAALLWLQPDASQATAFALAAAVLALRGAGGHLRFLALLALPIAAATWLRADPLEPVLHVEQAIQLCLSVSPVLGLAAMATLAVASLAPLAARGDRTASALAAYMVAAALAPLVGWYPVPLIGAGMTFPVGLWLGMGMLRAGPSPERNAA